MSIVIAIAVAHILWTDWGRDDGAGAEISDNSICRGLVEKGLGA